MRSKYWVFVNILLTVFVLTGCVGQAEVEPQPSASPLPPTTTPVPSQTASPNPTDTPLPTNTPTDTPIPTSTPDLQATAYFESTQVAEEYGALAAPDLEMLGYSDGDGELVWISDEPFVISASSGFQMIYDAIDDGEVYSSYIIHVDVTWESDTGLAGCGIIFHSEPNLANGKQYQFWTARFSGLPVWSVDLHEYGYYVSSATGGNKLNSAINQKNRSMNSYLLIIRDGILNVYANEVRLSGVSINSLDQGRIGFFLWQDSGETTCTFENAWVYTFDEW